MPSNFTNTMAAGTGGIAPSLIQLAQGFIKANPDVPGPFYYLGVAIFFGLGALVALFFAETNPKKAFFLGIGLPALVATAQIQGSPKSAFAELFPSAYAQPSSSLDRPAASTDMKLDFKSSSDCKRCEIWFADSAGRVIDKQILKAPTQPSQIVVPQGAKAFGVADPNSNFRFVPLPTNPTAPVTVEFSRKYSPWNDFRRGLGAYDMKSYDSSIQIKQQ